MTTDETQQEEDHGVNDAATSGQSYPEIVWAQFKKNTFAYYSMWFFLILLVIAIFAPLIASNRPLVFFDGEEVLFPWFRSLFWPEQGADLIFNMAMIAFFPWVIVSLFVNRWGKSHGIIGFRRLWHICLLFFVVVAAMSMIFSVKDKGFFAEDGEYLFRPKNPYKTRNFIEEEFQAREAAPEAPSKSGIYVPIMFGPTEQDLDSRYQKPGYRKKKQSEQSDGTVVVLQKDLNDCDLHLLGTDGTGRDVLSRLIYGVRVSMSVGFVAVIIYITIGIVIGALAGYFGGIMDMVLSRVIEVVMLFPAFFLILILIERFGRSIWVVMLVIGVTSWPRIARLIRGEVLKQRSIEYTTAARALGASPLRIVFRHVLPNSLSPALVSVPFGISSAIIVEASMSLLGFGVNPPAPSWGQFLNEAYYDYHNWWMIVVPSIAIFLTVTTFNLVGAGLRDAMDPRLRV